MLGMCFWLLGTSHHVVASNEYTGDEVKHSIKKIVSKGPFPRKVTEKRWTLDIKNDFKFDEEDIESSSIPQYIIELIALMSEHILLVIIIIVVLLLYFNRHLLNFEKLSQDRKTKSDISVSSTQPDKNKNYEEKEIEQLLKEYYTNNEYRELISLLYQYITHREGIPVNLTEQEISRHLEEVGNQNTILALLIQMRIDTAYRHHSVDQAGIDKLLMLWQSDR